MLIRFEVENFRGFNRRIRFDLTAGSYEFNPSVVYNGLVKNAIVYGKNGTGKSSLGAALFDIVSTLTDKNRMHPRYLNPYTNLYNRSLEALFCYVFNFNGQTVEYSYSKTSPLELSRERLICDGELLIDFDYAPGGVRFVRDNLIGQLNVTTLDGKLSAIKYIRNNLPPNAVPAISKLVDFSERMLWYRSLSDGNHYSGFTSGTGDMVEEIWRAGRLGELEQFLRSNELDYHLAIDENDANHTLYVIFPDGRRAPFYSIISTGTRALTLFFFWSKKAFEKVSFLFIDEFDAFFHYESAEKIVLALNAARNLQSVITSHNVYLMQNHLTRPDCCYLMTKNGISPLCKCTDRVIREAHNLEKMYVNGAFVD